MNNPLGVSPGNGIRDPHEVKKNLLTSVGIESTTSGLDRSNPEIGRGFDFHRGQKIFSLPRVVL